MCILIFWFTLGAEESQSIWSFIRKVCNAPHSSCSSNAGNTIRRAGGIWRIAGGHVNRNQVHTSPYTVNQQQDQTWNYGLEVSLACILSSQLIPSPFGEFWPCTVWKTEAVRTQSSLACPGAPALQVLLIRKLKLVVLYFFLTGM